MTLLSLEQILQLHVLVVQKTGGDSGLRDLGRLESAIATQTQNIFGEELYPTAFVKAAALIRGVVDDRPFVNGNKRTAMLVGLTFLKINSVMVRISRGELKDFAVKVAVQKLDVQAIAMWLEQRAV